MRTKGPHSLLMWATRRAHYCGWSQTPQARHNFWTKQCPIIYVYSPTLRTSNPSGYNRGNIIRVCSVYSDLHINPARIKDHAAVVRYQYSIKPRNVLKRKADCSTTCACLLSDGYTDTLNQFNYNIQKVLMEQPLVWKDKLKLLFYYRYACNAC